MLHARRLREGTGRHRFAQRFDPAVAASCRTRWADWRRGGAVRPGNKETRMSSSAKRSVTITLDGSNKAVSIPLMEATLGTPVFDIRKLYGDLGVFTFDPGYGGTAACESKITYIDGDEGVLLYRGYPIEQLAEKSTFLEICYLLINGELPTPAQFKEYEQGIMRHTMLHEQIREF